MQLPLRLGGVKNVELSFSVIKHAVVVAQVSRRYIHSQGVSRNITKAGQDLERRAQNGRLSKLWTPTQAYADVNEGEKNDDQSLLFRAGFIRQASSGIFHFLPLGLRVQAKIENLIDRHMESLGASKLALSSITTQQLWIKSGRFDEDGAGQPEIFRVTSSKGAGKWLLAPTHEEEITNLAAGALEAYRDVPLRLYQISRKYRHELRPRQGLLRGREFLMKDLYTFDATPEAALSTYQAVKETYGVLFSELKIPFMTAEADSGDMGGKLNHEFHYESNIGEDTLFSCQSCGYTANEETAVSRSDETARTGPIFAAYGNVRDTLDRVVILGRNMEANPRELNWHAIKRAVPGVEFDATSESPYPLYRWPAPFIETGLPKPGLRIIIDHSLQLKPSVADAMTRETFLEFPNSLSHHNYLQPYRDIMLDLLTEDQTLDHDRPWHFIFNDPTTNKAINVLALAPGDPCPKCTGTLSMHKAIELGHTFHLGTRYTIPLSATVSSPDPSSPPIPLQMGCHGIGVTRLIGAVAAKLSDARGLNWPAVIAPFEVVIIAQEGRDWEAEAERLYRELLGRGIDVAIDDRMDKRFRLSWKMKDADMIGYPLIIIVSKRTMAQGRGVEVQCRRLEYKRDHNLETEDFGQVLEDLLEQL